MNAVRRQNTTCIENNEKLENHELLRILKPNFKFVKIPDHTEFLKFLKFAFSVCDVS